MVASPEKQNTGLNGTVASDKKKPIPPQVSMNEQIRKIREEIVKEFDQKYQASLLDVDLYKEQLENNLKETEKRHQ